MSKWRGLFISLFFVGSFFIAWDILYTKFGTWGFNDNYLSGVKLLLLPIEEWLFFITVPFACLFLNEVLNYFIKRDVLGKAAPYIASALILIILPVALFILDKLYTSITFILTALLLVYHAFVVKSPYLGRFFLGYFVSLIPFFFVNGILTSTMIRDQVVWHNDAMNLSIRLGTIPIEDSIYLLSLLLMTTTIYEHLEQRKSIKERDAYFPTSGTVNTVEKASPERL